ncbi:protein XRP2 [Trypanosoma conorhini]|uniref:Protein XRP2 n=1 Tax=Trypanosoma conorhini TaxID=83891 RepID=A0A422PY49_9TRYP|nr:protein XRP2 [Trypanosoma conorhini]RNF22689.1 protein XRP2 [Trypanosoma conorhini]
MGSCTSCPDAAQEVAAKAPPGWRGRLRRASQRKQRAAGGGHEHAEGASEAVGPPCAFFSWETEPLLFDPASAPLFRGKYGEEALKEAGRLRAAAPTSEAANLPPHSLFLRLPGEIRGQRITAYENSHCAILLLDHCDSVSLHECEHCFIFIGPTSGSVFMDRCHHCVVVGCCAQLRLRGCRQLQLSLAVATMPVLEESTGIGVCSLSGWFVYPLMPLHMQRAGLSAFNNFYATVQDFTPRPVAPRVGRGCSASGSSNNLYYIHQAEFERSCWLRWQRLGGGPVAHDDVELTLAGEHEARGAAQQEAGGQALAPPSLLSCPLVLLQSNEQLPRAARQSGNPLLQLPVDSEGLLEMFHHTVVVPCTFGSNRALPRVVSVGKWEPRLFVVRTAGGGGTIAMRIVRAVELGRRRGFLARMRSGLTQAMESDDDGGGGVVDGDVLLLNTVELYCTEALVRRQLAPVLRELAAGNKNDATVQRAVAAAAQRMSKHACIFLLALLRPAAKTDTAVEGAQAIFASLGAPPPPPPPPPSAVAAALRLRHRQRQQQPRGQSIPAPAACLGRRGGRRAMGEVCAATSAGPYGAAKCPAVCHFSACSDDRDRRWPCLLTEPHTHPCHDACVCCGMVTSGPVGRCCCFFPFFFPFFGYWAFFPCFLAGHRSVRGDCMYVFGICFLLPLRRCFC